MKIGNQPAGNYSWVSCNPTSKERQYIVSLCGVATQRGSWPPHS